MAADIHSVVEAVAPGSRPGSATAAVAEEEEQHSPPAHQTAEGPSEFRRFRRTQLWADSTRHSVGIGHLSSQVTFRNFAKNQSAN